MIVIFWCKNNQKDNTTNIRKYHFYSFRLNSKIFLHLFTQLTTDFAETNTNDKN